MTQALPYAELPLDIALTAFRQNHGLEDKFQTMRPEARPHYERHDMVHVLFGLDTSMRQEAHADGWTLFGTDISRAQISEFFGLPEEAELLRELGWWSVAKGYLAAVPDYARIAFKSRRMRRKWPWSDNAPYRQVKVGAIRREFGILEALQA